MEKGFLFITLIARVSAENFPITTAASLALDIGLHYHTTCFRILHGENRSLTEEHHTLQFVRLLMRGLANSSDSAGGIRLRTVKPFSFMKFRENQRKYQTRNQQSSMYQTCYKPLEVFFSTKENRESFSWLCNNYDTTKSIWLVFMINGFTEEQFFRNADIPFDINLLTVSGTEPEYRINEVFRVKRHSEIKAMNIGVWSPTARLKISFRVMYSRRSDLNGMIFRVGSIENWPISGFRPDGKGSLQLDGFFPSIWKELEEYMNCRSISYLSVDNTTGSRTNGKWNGLIGMLLRNEIDVIVSELNINLERKEFMDFPHPLLKTRHQVYYKMPGYNLSWTAVFDPFDFRLWLAILAWLVIGALVLIFSYKICDRFEPVTEIRKQPTRAFFFMLQSLCQQGYWQVPQSYACRIIFIAAYLMSAIIIPSYSGSLISSLTAQTPSRPFDSLTEMLLHKDKYKLIIPHNTAEYELFEKSTDPLYFQIFRDLLDPGVYNLHSEQDIVSHLCQKNLAMFAVESTTDSRISHTTDCHIIKFRTPLAIVYQGLGFRKSSPYTGLINYHLGRMDNAGIIKRHVKHFWFTEMGRREPELHQVSITQVLMIFVLLGIGMILSVFILLLEIIISKRIRKRSRWIN